MLNRVYIVVGLLAIAALAAAFVVPGMIRWADYRERLEAIATSALGTEVSIRGEIAFTLLPQPRMEFSDVVVGPVGSPALTIGAVEAEFSLFDFLRDQYSITRLVLNRPSLDVGLDESGMIASSLALGEGVNRSNVSIDAATIVDGAASLDDPRANRRLEASDIDGELRLGSLAGPFQFQGSGDYEQVRYQTRFSTSALDADGNSRLSASIRPESDAFAATLDGSLTPGIAPRFDGRLVYRQAPPPASTPDEVQGDLLFEADVEANVQRILLAAYTLQPDVNRAGTRLTGAAVIRIGVQTDFDAVISGGVASLPPRDARAEEGPQPYELVRLLGELPQVPVPPIPGRIGLDLAEINLRGIALRDVRMDATTEGTQWTIADFHGRLPGDTALNISGRLTSSDVRPGFEGEMRIETARLDALVQLWRRADEGNLLFNRPASYAADVVLADDQLSLANGVLTFGEAEHSLGLDIGFGAEPSLVVRAGLEALDAETSAALLATLPDPGADASFGLTFPRGAFTVSAAEAGVLDLSGRDLVAEGTWRPGVIAFSRLAASGFGGADLDLAGEVSGTLAAPRLAGSGSIGVQRADAPALAALYDAAGVSDDWRERLAASFPLRLAIEISPVGSGATQAIAASGTLGGSEIGLDLQFANAFANVMSEPIEATLNVSSADADTLVRQLGLGAIPLFAEAAPVMLTTQVSGIPAESLVTAIHAQSGRDFLGFEGELIVSNPAAVSGAGTASATLGDAAGLAYALGAGGVDLPAISARAQVSFVAGEQIEISDIAGTSGTQPFSGTLFFDGAGGANVASGTLTLASVDVGALAASVFGAAALIPTTDQVWPAGPIAIGDGPRTSRGSIAVTTPAITSGPRVLASNVTLDYVWDETSQRIRGLEGTTGGGELGLDIAVCCAGTLPDKNVTGRLSLGNVDIDAALPERPAGGLDGRLSLTGRFEGTAQSLAGLAASLSGEGGFTLENLQIGTFDGAVFSRVAAFTDVLSLDPDALANLVAQALEQGTFESDRIEGAFTVAGGTLRTGSLAAEEGSARLFGELNVTLSDLGLDGSFALTPTSTEGTNALVSETTSQVSALIGGTLPEPTRELDLAPMVDSIQLRASEIELERLERIRMEDEARQREAAAERLRLIEAQRAAAAEAEAEAEAARLAEEEARRADAEATRAAAAEAERQRLLLQQQQPDPPLAPPVQTNTTPLPPLDIAPGNFQF